MAKILVAEDDNIIRFTLAGFLEQDGHDVVTVEDGQCALEILNEDSNFDLVLAELELPRLSGHLLFRLMQDEYPHIKQVLLTDYDIKHFISIATQFGFSNFVTKTIPLNFQDILAYMKALLEKDFFGIDRYLGAEHEFLELDVVRSTDIADHIHKILEQFEIDDEECKLEQAFVEILTNAVYYGVLHADGAQKHNWEREFLIPEGQVTVECGQDSEKIAVAICDTGGRLNKKQVLRWLSRQVRVCPQGLPLGMRDTHGRGLYLSREFTDRLIINIEKGKRTEIICIKYFNQTGLGPKPLLINEV
ncbi:MAG: response regulator [Myxococcota bacterium]|nr:response regulator [Myxococcota bacterium]